MALMIKTRADPTDVEINTNTSLIVAIMKVSSSVITPMNDNPFSFFLGTGNSVFIEEIMISYLSH